MRSRLISVAVLVVLGACLGRASLAGRSISGPLITSPAQTDHAVDPSLLKGLQYRMIGPHRGGRVTAVSGVPSERGTFYMGSSGGGVWKSTDYGEVWTNLSDGYFASASIGAIAVSDSNPQVVYAGTGSACLRGNIQAGRGIYKSTDAGATWHAIGLEDGGQIAKIRIDPTDPNLVYVAVQGHAFGPYTARGVFRSRDGGKTWTKVLFVNERTGASDLAMDPGDPRVLYATMWTGALNPWGLPSTSPDGGVFKTTDGGDHWSKLAGGLPQASVGRIGVTVSRSNPKRVWALVGDVPEGGVFRSDDGGGTFNRVNTDRSLTGRSSDDAHIFADPKNENVVYAANQDFYKSTDGGVAFQPIPMPHGDDHAMWIDPNDTQVMIVGNDGGATISVTGGRSWSSQLNQPTGEMYRVTIDNQVRTGCMDRSRISITRLRCPVGRRASASGCSFNIGTRSEVRRRGGRGRSARSEHRFRKRPRRTSDPLRPHRPENPDAEHRRRRPRRRPFCRHAADADLADRAGRDL